MAALRRFSAVVLLLGYLAVMAGNCYAALTCCCVFGRGGTGVAEAGACGGCCAERHDTPAFNPERCCNHSHSNTIELYTQWRGADGALARLAAVSQSAGCVWCAADTVAIGQSRFEYGEYLVFQLPAASASAARLRAPPVRGVIPAGGNRSDIPAGTRRCL